MTIPFAEGYDAYAEGVKVEKCPYKGNHAADWVKGWKECERISRTPIISERKTKKCKACQHIHWADEAHSCPTEEEIQQHNNLISAALDDEEIWGIGVLDGGY